MERVRAVLVGTGGLESYGRDQWCASPGGKARVEFGEDAARSLTGGSGMVQSGSGGNGSGWWVWPDKEKRILFFEMNF
jgi:hypothetical protein